MENTNQTIDIYQSLGLFFTKIGDLFSNMFSGADSGTLALVALVVGLIIIPLLGEYVTDLLD